MKVRLHRRGDNEFTLSTRVLTMDGERKWVSVNGVGTGVTSIRATLEVLQTEARKLVTPNEARFAQPKQRGANIPEVKQKQGGSK